MKIQKFRRSKTMDYSLDSNPHFHSGGCGDTQCQCHDWRAWVICEEFMREDGEFCHRCGWHRRMHQI